MAEHKLDIFQVLNSVNAKKVNFFDQLSDEEQKALQPYVLMQWLVGTDDEGQIMLLNEFLNPVVFALSNHKKLLWQLLTVCNSGIRQRYEWTKLPGKQTINRPMCITLLEQVYGYNTNDANDALKILSPEAVINMAFDRGMSGEDISKIKKELKK